MASAPQFGAPEPGTAHQDRPAAFGIVERDGKLACVHVVKPGHGEWTDLPGGALDPGEDAAQAVVREFAEETGLIVEAGAIYAYADQYFVKTDGEPVNNRGAFFTLVVAGENPALKVEDDHALVWLEPQAALLRLRHEAHAWAVAAWLRQEQRS